MKIHMESVETATSTRFKFGCFSRKEALLHKNILSQQSTHLDCLITGTRHNFTVVELNTQHSRVVTPEKHPELSLQRLFTVSKFQSAAEKGEIYLP